MQRAQGFAQRGSQMVWTAGRASETLHPESFPWAVISVFNSGTTDLAAIYADNQAAPTPRGNPFTADFNGLWYFYAPNGRYDVMLQAYGVFWTLGDLLLFDPLGA